MPGYEISFLCRIMTRPEAAATLKRTALEVLNRKGFIRSIENLGTRDTPYKISEHGAVHRQASQFLMKFESPPNHLDDIMEAIHRDVDIIKSVLIKNRPVEEFECTLHEELLPPAYRKDVQEMIEIGKKKIKPKYDNKTGLPVTPFQR